MPDYFIALISQYSGALNQEQAERFARSIIDAWYFSSDEDSRKKLQKLLPDYLKPKKNLFFNSIRQRSKISQDDIFFTRLMIDLSKTDQDEVVQIIKGVMKSLKVVSSQSSKFAYSNLFSSKKLQKIFIEA
jgi:hypothetical protein